ncbi:MAG TPA: alkaline phosphatase family protein, partial [Sedimentisphaerales bacterium]|nr:alkaline phosphatase family protein [Sedimentisphaerales bacterium]
PSDPPAYKDIKGFVGRMAGTVADRARAAEHLIFTRRPDLCVVHFESPDHVQHGLWCDLDSQDPLFDEERHGYILEHFYGALDKAMKDTWEAFARAAEGDFATIVISDHGFELHRKRFNLGNWLHGQGLLQWSRKLGQPPLHRRFAHVPGLKKLFRFIVPGMPAETPVSALHLDPQMIDWDNSATFPVGHNGEAGIYLLHDDAPRRVNTISRITKGLKAIRDSFTSAPLIQAVYRKEEVYRGPLMYLMPDLIVVPAAGCTCTTWCWPARPLIEDIHPESDPEAGKHSRDGVLVAAGRDIAERAAVTAQLTDIAPTILCALGINIPSDWDGRVISSIFTSGFLSARGLSRDGVKDNPG